MFDLISFSPHFIDHVSILFPSVHSPSHSFICHGLSHYIYLIWLHLYYMGIRLYCQFDFQPIPSLEINDLRVSLDKFLILDRYSLLEAEIRWFYYSMSLYIKQETQHGVRRNVWVCSAADVYLLIYSTQAYVGKR